MPLTQKDNEILARYGIAQGGTSSSGMPLTITQDEMALIEAGNDIGSVVGNKRFRKPGLLDKLEAPAREAGQEFRRRIEGFAEKTESGEQGTPEQVLQTAGAMVTGASKAIGGVGFELAKAIAPKWLEDLASKGVEKVAESKISQRIVGEWSKFLNDMTINYPRQTRDLLGLLEVGAGVAELSGTGKAVRSVAEGAVGAAEAGLGAGARVVGAAAERVNPLMSGAKNAIQDSYDRWLGTGRQARKLESEIEGKAAESTAAKIGETFGEEGKSVTEQAVRSGVTVPQAKLISDLGVDDVAAAKKMVNVADKGSESLRDRHLTRPMFVTGETAVKKMDTIESYIRSKGDEIEQHILNNNKTVDLSERKDKWLESIGKKYGIKQSVDESGEVSLDFGKSSLAEGDQGLVKSIFDRLQSGSSEDALDIWRWRQKIARETGVFKANKVLSPGGESISEDFRRMLGSALDDEIGGYSQLAKEYAPFARFMEEWEAAIGKGFINKGEDTLNRRVSELMKTVMNQNGSKWIDLAERMDALAPLAGYEGTDNLINQILTANMIESLWEVQPERTIEKLIGKGVAEGAKDAVVAVGTGNVKSLTNILGRVVTNIAGKSKEEQKRLIKKLLQMEVDVPSSEILTPTLPKVLAADAADLTGTIPAEVESLVKNATKYDKTFKSTVEEIGNSGNWKVEHGPVKKAERLLEKIEKENETIDTLRDTNRSTIVVSDPKELEKVIVATTEKFGAPSRVKDKFSLPDGHYKSAIINVKTPYGHQAEVAVTTPEYWNAKMKMGGQDLYNKVRSKVAGFEKYQSEMEKLYSDAERELRLRLNSS